MHYFQITIILTSTVFLYLAYVRHFGALLQATIIQVQKTTVSRVRWLYCCLYSGSTGFESRLEHPVFPALDLFLDPSREHQKLYHDRFLPHSFLFAVLYHPVFRQLVNWPADIFFNFSTHKIIDIIFISLIDQNFWCQYFSSQEIVVY